MVEAPPRQDDSRAPIPSALDTFKDASMATCQQSTHFPGNLWEIVDIAMENGPFPDDWLFKMVPLNSYC